MARTASLTWWWGRTASTRPCAGVSIQASSLRTGPSARGGRSWSAHTGIRSSDSAPLPAARRLRSRWPALTNLYNHTQPLIRYELTDRFTRHPADPGSGYLRATVEGRADDTFYYGATVVDPLIIRTVMVRTPAALEHQVRQTGRGIDIAVVASEPLDHAALAAALARSLRAAGLPDPQVHVRQVPDIARHPETGKARRFIPL